MNRSKPLFYFTLFFACFLLALTLKFQYLDLNQDESPDHIAEIIVSIFFAGLFLAQVFRSISQTKSHFRALVDGLSLSLIAILALALAETSLSARLFRARNQPEQFSLLDGHCGVYAGRTILKLIHAETIDPIDGALKEFKLNQHCRLKQLGLLMQDRQAFCQPHEDLVECEIRWMAGIAEHGYWSRYTRKFFFDQVIKGWPQSKREESIVNYVIKDQELESGRQSIVKQAGIEDGFSSRYLFLQGKEELDNLLLTQEIFLKVGSLLPELKSSPPPYLFKFKDLKEDVDAKLEKIPALEKELEKMQASLSH